MGAPALPADAWGGPGAVTLVPLTMRPTPRPAVRGADAPARPGVVVPLLRLALLLAVVAACTTGPPTYPAHVLVAPAPGPGRTAAPDPAAVVAALVGAGSVGHVSLAAVDLATGRSFGAAPTNPVHTASVVKLDILETLLLRAQDGGRRLTAPVDRLATAMIEDSDNDAATRLWGLAGGAAGLTAANARLGLHGTRLDDAHWGTSTTCAADQVALLGDLARPGPLGPAARAYATGLLSHVQADQRWGVSAAADPGAVTGLKDGWLPLDDDTGYWVVGSVGVTTVAGDPVALAVLTEHQPTEAAGIVLVEALARVAAQAVTGDRDARPDVVARQ